MLNLVEKCLSLDISPSQLAICELVVSKRHLMNLYKESTFGYDWGKDVLPLVEKGFIKNLNAENCTDLYNLVATDKGRDIVEKRIDKGHEIWDMYPATFPLGEGRHFLARTGIDRDTFATLYIDKINDDDAAHEEVKKQLRRYIKFVTAGTLNGKKIIDFLRDEVWTLVATIEDNFDNPFGTDA